MAYLSQEQLILGHCQWLFNKEVQIITFVDYPEGTSDSNRGYYAVVVPKAKLLAKPNIDNHDRILFQSEVPRGYQTRDSAIAALLTAIEERIGMHQIMGVRSSGQYYIDDDFPVERYYEPPSPRTTLILDVPVVSNTVTALGVGPGFANLAELNRRVIREEIDLTLRKIFATSNINTTPAPRVEPGGLAELNRKVIREELDLALREVFVTSDTNTTPTPRAEFEGLAELNRKAIREEIDLALRKVFGGLPEY